MLLKENPFYIISASMRDNNAEIMDKAEEAALLQDEQLCRDAKTILLNPNKRIEAEVSWLPGLGSKRVKEVLNALTYSPGEVFQYEFLMDKSYSCSRANILINALATLKDLDVKVLETWIETISVCFSNIDTEMLLDTINDSREAAGISDIANVNTLEDVLRENKHFFVKIIKNAMNDLGTEEMVSMFTAIVDADTCSGRKQGTEIIEELVESYELESQSFFNRANLIIEELVKTIKTDAMQNVSEYVLQQKVNKLINTVQQWDKIAQPIQVCDLSKGLEHEESKHIASVVRDVAITLYNDYGKLQAAQAITSMMKQVFAEVITVAEKNEEDVKALSDIAQSKAKEKAEEEREMNYSAEFGLLFKSTVHMTREYLEFDGRKIYYSQVENILWGGVRKSVNGIPTGTTYTIKMNYQGGRNYLITFTGHEDVYSNIIERLWKGAAVRLMLQMIERFKTGEKYNFGNAVVVDDGILLTSSSWFSNDTRFYSWRDVSISNGPGYFCIQDKKNSSMSVKLDYLEIMDVHLLENILRVGFDKGISKISNALGE